jgi:hypothetical protein
MLKHWFRKDLVNPEQDRTPKAFSLLHNIRGPLSAIILVVGLALATPAVSGASEQPATGPSYTMTPRRIGASSAVVVALIGAITGARALARAAGKAGTLSGKRGATIALVLCAIGMIGGGLVVTTAGGGLGTGNGLGGGVVAMLTGLIGIALGGLARIRSRAPVKDPAPEAW